ncbi:MAG: GGDEF domain-containing protein [Gammaproteobacteria bacterium]|nr:GGDEF domain-containing protein [Gammaproteobacteria bacterium]
MAEKLRVMQADDEAYAVDRQNSFVSVGFDQAITDTESSSSLYRTQDISQLLDMFTNEARKLVPSDGIEYSEDTLGLYYIDGVPGRHRCDYTIRLGEQSLGNISFTRDNEFRNAELAVFENLVAGLVLPLQKALQYQRALRFALRDELTGIRNDVAYFDNIAYEIERARRYKVPFSLLLINLDNFRDINRQYGSDAGDALLVEVANRLEHGARNSDIIYRKGGDEFLVFLPNTGKSAALKFAERIKNSVLTGPCTVESAKIHFTLTMGIVSVSSSDTAYTMIDRADKVLYRAKILGKNRILAEAGTDSVLPE